MGTGTRARQRRARSATGTYENPPHPQCGKQFPALLLHPDPREARLLEGYLEAIGVPGRTRNTVHHVTVDDKERIHKTQVKDHDDALDLALQTLLKEGVLADLSALDATVHRVVHGGPHLSAPSRITAHIMQHIQHAAALAPLHNPHNIKGIRTCQNTLRGIPHIAVFDTGFHSTLQPAESTYGLPFSLTAEEHIRRYGFHGISVSSVLFEAEEEIGRRSRVVVCHVGGGVSVTGVLRGRSRYTSMGFTPLEGDHDGDAVGKCRSRLDFPLAQERLHAGATRGTAPQWIRSPGGLRCILGRARRPASSEAQKLAGGARHPDP
ncbi:MAG: hypothetical protein HC945_02745 [Nitrosarchaeum sp.]|nr:hypothetical protein [Nitrosarchaeum sp.]